MRKKLNFEWTYLVNDLWTKNWCSVALLQSFYISLIYFWSVFPFFTPKTPDSLRFSGVFRGYKMKTLVGNGLRNLVIYFILEKIYACYFVVIMQVHINFQQKCVVMPQILSNFNILGMFVELDITRKNNYFYDVAGTEKVKYFATYFLNYILWNLIEYPQL